MDKYNGLKVGDSVRVAPLCDLVNFYDKGKEGFPIALIGSMKNFAGTVQIIKSISNGCTVPAVILGCSTWSWDIRSLTKVADMEGVKMFKEADKVVRTRRFTESFVEGEVHEVQRVSEDGQYIWVGGYKGKTPARYFDYAPRTKQDKVLAITEQYGSTLTEGGLTSFDEPIGRIAGDNPSGCGLVANTEPKPVPNLPPKQECKSTKDLYLEGVANGEIPSNEIEHGIVAGLLLQGVALQYYSILTEGWVNATDHIKVNSIPVRSWRIKPDPFMYYGNELPKPIDPRTTHEGVFGISFVNRKTYPCSNGVARTNVRNGQGHYWSTQEQAELVLATILKPFLDLESK